MTRGIDRALVGVDIQRIELHVAVDAADLQQHVIDREIGVTGQTQLLALERFDIQVQRQMHVRHLRQDGLREQIFQRFTQRFLFRLWVLDLRLDNLFLRHVRYLRQRDQQSLQGGWRQGEVFLLPAQAGGEIHHRHGGVVDFDIHVVQRHPIKGDGVRCREIQRAAVLFFNRR